MRRSLFLVLLLTLSLQAFAGTGRILILNSDKPGQGFNDPTPRTPVGGNSGTTLGQQRLIVFEAAAARWQSILETDVDIRVTATFAPTTCTETSATLAFAYAMDWKHSFAAAPRANVWYPIALANKFAGADLEPNRNDIFIQFNAAVDNPTCLGDSSWYYGLDRNHNGNDVDLYVVVLHELAHGLGISGATGAPGFKDNRPAVFDTLTYDESLGRLWDQMSEQERAISQVNTGNLTWDGPYVRAFAKNFLAPTVFLAVTEPAPVARNYDIGTASFGQPASLAALSGQVVQALDASDEAGPTPTDGCSAFANAGEMAGKIALIDRGTCFFVEKARNAQAAGARGVVIVDNQRPACAPAPPSLGTTTDASDISIPVVSITAADGDALKAQLNAGVNGALRVDATQLWGASPAGRVRLFAPCTVEGGSSTHHWDSVATPNLLMEPDINSDLVHGVDLTLYQLLDIGWTAQPKTGRRILKR